MVISLLQLQPGRLPNHDQANLQDRTWVFHLASRMPAANHPDRPVQAHFVPQNPVFVMSANNVPLAGGGGVGHVQCFILKPNTLASCRFSCVQGTIHEWIAVAFLKISLHYTWLPTIFAPRDQHSSCRRKCRLDLQAYNLPQIVPLA